MKKVGVAFVYLNAICGMIFITMASSQFGSSMLAFLLVNSILFLLEGFASAWKSPTRIHSKSEDVAKHAGKTHQRLSSAVFVFNLIAFIFLWLFPQLSLNSESTWNYLFFMLFFIILPCLDFGVLGVQLAQSIERRSSENLNLE